MLKPRPKQPDDIVAQIKASTDDQITEELVRAFMGRLDAYISNTAHRIKNTDSPSVPVGVIENILRARTGSCSCAAVRNIREQL